MKIKMAKIVKVLVAGEEFQFTPTETDDYSILDVQSLLDRIQRHRNGEVIPGLKSYTLSEEGKAILAAAGGNQVVIDQEVKDAQSSVAGSAVGLGLVSALAVFVVKRFA